jgi:hypothetical protein
MDLGGLAGVAFLIAVVNLALLVGVMGTDMSDHDERRK